MMRTASRASTASYTGSVAECQYQCGRAPLSSALRRYVAHFSWKTASSLLPPSPRMSSSASSLDVTPFTSPSAPFSPVSWLNAALSSSGQNGADAALSSALVRLQLLSAEASGRIEGSMARVATALPRLSRDARALSAELPALAAALSPPSAAGSQTTDAAAGSLLSLPQSSLHAPASAVRLDAPFLVTLAALDASKGRLEAVASSLAHAVRSTVLGPHWNALRNRHARTMS